MFSVKLVSNMTIEVLVNSCLHVSKTQSVLTIKYVPRKSTKQGTMNSLIVKEILSKIKDFFCKPLF